MLDLVTIFLIGFFGSWGHCVGMCGGFVVTYSVKLGEKAVTHSFRDRILPHLLYNLGRSVTYCIIGLLFAVFGQLFSHFLSVRFFQCGVQILAGVVMVLIAVDLLGMGRFPVKFKVPLYSQFILLVGRRLSNVHNGNIFVLGLILGWLPCGLVYAAAAKAVASGSIGMAALMMFVFGLGTMPALFIVGLSSHLLTARWRQKLYAVAGILVILLGLLTIYNGVVKFKHPAAANSMHHSMNHVH